LRATGFALTMVAPSATRRPCGVPSPLRPPEQHQVPIHFQSLRSSSSGNCLALWTPTSSILIDCGVSTQYKCRELLEEHARRCGSLDAVVVTHAHGDHMSYASLRVLGQEGIPVHGDARVIRQLCHRHSPEDWPRPPKLVAISGRSLDVGDLRVIPIEVPHAPGFPTFGFVIEAGWGKARKKLVVCTDLHEGSGILPHLVDADFIFVEANHDLDLLRRYPNPASRFHLNNVKTGRLLCEAACRSASPPRLVMLGHLSEERNSRRLAIDEVRRAFGHQRVAVRFELEAAPAHTSSNVIEI
jgi:phosphoribosyl 1,2-cyclic phosphodiesterase